MIACRPWRIAPFGQNSWQQKQWMQTPRSKCGFFFFIAEAKAKAAEVRSNVFARAK